MATTKRSLKLFLYKFWNDYQQKKGAGFTLTELLVTVLMASLVIAALLAVVVELLQTDQRESVSNQTQQEMQMAMNYIVEDLREAVYVYGSNCHPNDSSSCPPPTSYIPNFDSSEKIVLAFWKPELIKVSELPNDCSTLVDKETECENLKTKRRAYSLVVYLQSTEADPTWKGESRLRRYELRKYTNVANLTRSNGFVDPIENQDNFATWPYDNIGTNLQTEPPIKVEHPPAVLVDFVDKPTSAAPSDLPTCDATNYLRVPSDAVNNTSFFACVSKTDNALGLNQDIFLYLRGNPTGRGGSNNSFESLPTLQTQVTIGGVINKN